MEYSSIFFVEALIVGNDLEKKPKTNKFVKKL